MRIRRVRAKAFGPFCGAVLDLGPGMTVVHGPNEAGKSTWHAAIFAGLCGLRRVRGGTRAEDRDFAERHRPWDGDEWAVSIEIELDGGRRLELVQNLEDQVGCRVIDLATGREVGGELDLLHEGAPDGARLFGLTRRTLPYSMFVRQADILGILGKDRPQELHEELERAAATAGADETAERAIRTLRDFRRENVGPDKPGGARPLGLALAALAEAERQAAEARRKHVECLALAGQCEAAEVAVRGVEAELQAALRLIAEREHARAARKLAEARTLGARFSDGAPPDPARGREVRDRVAAALAAFDRCPASPTPLGGPGAAEIEAQIAALPEPPKGDVEPPPEVLEAEQAWRRAALERDAHQRMREAIAGPEPTRREPGRRWFPVAAVLVASGGLLLLAFDRPLLGAGLVAVALGLLVLARRPAEAAMRRARQELGARIECFERDQVALTAAAEAAAGRLGALLAGRSPHVPAEAGDLQRKVERYRALCRVRAEQLQASLRRDDLARRLADRSAAERAAARDLARRQEVHEELRQAAAACGVEHAELDGLAVRLGAFVQRADAEVAAAARDREAWARLEQLLEGRGLAWLEEDLQGRARELQDLPAATPPRAIEPGGDPGPARRALELRARAARTELDALRGRLTEREHEAPDVARAEEQLEQVRSDVARLRALEATLAQTLAFLSRARDDVQRDFAPHLAEAIRSRLARITGGRYVDATVDPATLDVRVRDAAGELIRAGLLSQGTTEQVYLLLRVALAERLVVGPERAPLILDDVTAQADPERTTAVLDLLHELSRERQIVLFSQESEVRAWAAARLVGEADRLVDLAPPGPASGGPAPTTATVARTPVP